MVSLWWVLIGFLIGFSAILVVKLMIDGLRFVKKREHFATETDTEEEEEENAVEEEKVVCKPGIDIPPIADGLLDEKTIDFPQPSMLGVYLSSYDKTSVQTATKVGFSWKNLGNNVKTSYFTFTKSPAFSAFQGVVLHGNPLKGPDSDQLVPENLSRTIGSCSISWVSETASFTFISNNSKLSVFKCGQNNGPGIQIAWIPHSNPLFVTLEVIWGGADRRQTWDFQKSLLMTDVFVFTLIRNGGSLKLWVGPLRGVSKEQTGNGALTTAGNISLSNTPCIINENGLWDTRLYAFMIWYAALADSDIPRIHQHFQTFDPIYQQAFADRMFAFNQLETAKKTYEDKMGEMRKEVAEAEQCWRIFNDLPTPPERGAYRVTLNTTKVVTEAETTEETEEAEA